MHRSSKDKGEIGNPVDRADGRRSSGFPADGSDVAENDDGEDIHILPAAGYHPGDRKDGNGQHAERVGHEISELGSLA